MPLSKSQPPSKEVEALREIRAVLEPKRAAGLTGREVEILIELINDALNPT